MADLSPTTVTMLLGLAVSLSHAVVWLAKAVFKSHERPKNGNGDHVKGIQSGQLTPEDWEGRMAKLHHASTEAVMADMRKLMEARTMTLVEKVTQPIVLEIRGLRDDLTMRHVR